MEQQERGGRVRATLEDLAEIRYAIDQERGYQDATSRRVLTVGEELLLAEEYLGKARTAWQRSDHPTAGLDELRKVAAIVQRCFERHGCPRRIRGSSDAAGRGQVNGFQATECAALAFPEVPHVPRNDRGFVNYGEHPVVCDYGTSIEVYESSSVEPHVWLALEQEPSLHPSRLEPGIATAYLAPEQAVELLRRVAAWLCDQGEVGFWVEQSGEEGQPTVAAEVEP